MTNTLEPELTEQVRLATVTRTIVRAVSSELTLQRVVEVCQTAILEGFRASGVYIWAFKEDNLGHEALLTDTGLRVEFPVELKSMGRTLAKKLCEVDAVAILEKETMTPEGLLTPAEQQPVLDLLSQFNIRRLLVVPIAVAHECLGVLVMSRDDLDAEWTSGEQRSAMDVGRDLGRALATARTFEKERRVVEELREVNGYKTRLITTLAHELKNPLTAILGHVEILDAGMELDHGVLHSLEVIERGGLRMQRLVEDLLVLSRSTETDRPFTPSAVDLTEVVAEVTELLGVEMLRKDLSLVLEVPEVAVSARGERQELDLVLTNLLSNAVKYTRPGGTITVRLGTQNKTVRLEINDTGLGMSREDQGHLFQEFFRSTNPEALANPGSGLGLAIVRQAVDRHSGDIAFTSELGVGTTFVVTLPAWNRSVAGGVQRP